MRHEYAERRSGASTWLSWGGYPDEPNWKAHFSFGTPTTLVAAFTASLVSTEPLHRTGAGRSRPDPQRPLHSEYDGQPVARQCICCLATSSSLFRPAPMTLFAPVSALTT
ncbi:DUF317 domain-containing protein [Streptomyces tauricus]|uniref:DUF317 domain-containing protein n=1 Tax=Streptomyces tauricus TaxID=68274 RepID=UPI0033B71D9F